ncbi:MAG: holo-[acyl-carrier-protein] synthase [Ruminococcaceae bacterium]|nr:holo-[acyl-carrier-protein] synthase [Oscillospiraceae bacterium]
MKVGIDTVDIKRIEELINKERFLERVFSEDEIAEFKKRNEKAEHIAAAFAAKEAFSKALGTGIAGFKLTEVSLLHSDNGKPFLQFSGKALSIVKEKGLLFDVSITHTDTFATAIVIGWC